MHKCKWSDNIVTTLGHMAGNKWLQCTGYVISCVIWTSVTDRSFYVLKLRWTIWACIFDKDISSEFNRSGFTWQLCMFCFHLNFINESLSCKDINIFDQIDLYIESRLSLRDISSFVKLATLGIWFIKYLKKIYWIYPSQNKI